MTYTIGKLAHKFNLSRSTLLYYDSIGLLPPSERGSGNYRFYSENDCKRLEQIAMYRQIGLSLRQIKEILDNTKCDVAASLESKLEEINQEIKMLRHQQHFIIEFLQNNQLWQRIGTIQKEQLVEVLQSAGIDDKAQWRLHNQFEKKFSEQHEAFLQLLGLTPGQIVEIRNWSLQKEK